MFGKLLDPRVLYYNLIAQGDGYLSSKGCTMLQIDASGTGIRKELDGDVRFCIAPQKPVKNLEAVILHAYFLKFSERA